KIDFFFLRKLQRIVETELSLRDTQGDLPSCRRAKELGFSDTVIARAWGWSEDEVMDYRKKAGLVPVYKMVDTCAGEFESSTPYYYSTYEKQDEVAETQKQKVVVLGSGPIRIG